MNFDELVLRNVIPMEEAELVHNPSSSSTVATSLFLGKRNVDLEPQTNSMGEVSVSTEEVNWVQYERALLADSRFPISETFYSQKSAADFGVGLFENNVPAMAATSNSDFPVSDSGRKRRHLDDMKEKTIERRQRRMIKNRESAARSRARKQAYTNQLEHEVFCLRKTNSWLRKQEEVEKLLSNPDPMPKYQLRRTSSALF